MSDKKPSELATASIVALGTAGAGVANPYLGAAATAIAPVAQAALDRFAEGIRRRRAENAALTLEAAASEREESLEQFLVLAASSGGRHELLIRVLQIAQDVSFEDKRQALARALAYGVDDDARIDDELLFVRAVADLDVPHIRVLRSLPQLRREPGAPQSAPGTWTIEDLRSAQAGLADAVPALLATLEFHGLIAVVTDTYESQTYPDKRHIEVTELGRRMLERLATSHEAA